MKQSRKKDLASGVLFFALGLFAVFVAIPFGVHVPSTVELRALSPDFWPLLISGAVILSALFLIFEAYFMPTQPADEEDVVDSTEFQLDPVPATLRTCLLIIGLFGFYFSLTTLGIVAASIILLTAMMLFYGERRLVLIGVLGIGTPVLLYLFFRHVASVPIPLGMFEFLS